MTKQYELLPCPFCGGKAGYYVSGLKGHVYCTVCGVTTDGSYTNREPDWAKEETRLWNTRVYPPDVQKAILKDTPRLILNKTDRFSGECPNCGNHVWISEDICHECGQRLDW